MFEHPSYDRDEFDTLLRRCLDGLATEAETVRFRERLGESAECRAEYAEMMALIAVTRISAKILRGDSAPAAARAPFRFRWAVAAAAAFVLFFAGSATLFNRGKTAKVCAKELVPVAAIEQEAHGEKPVVEQSPAAPDLPTKISSATIAVAETKQEQNMNTNRILKTAAVAAVAAAVVSPPRIARAEETGVSTAVTAPIALDTRVGSTAPTIGQNLETRVGTTAVTKKTNLNTTKFKGLVVMLM